MGRTTLLFMAMSIGHATGSMREMEGISFPTTETEGGAVIVGTLDWGLPSNVAVVDYTINWDGEEWDGEMALIAQNSYGFGAQLVYMDWENQLSMTATSADGVYELNPDLFHVDAGYGGLEAWTLTHSEPFLNRYGTITSIRNVPEPQTLALLGGLGLLLFCRRAKR